MSNIKELFRKAGALLPGHSQQGHSEHDSGVNDPQGSVDPPPVMQEIGEMLEFALANPDKSQVTLLRRKSITPSQWEAMSEAEQGKIRDSIGESHAMPE